MVCRGDEGGLVEAVQRTLKDFEVLQVCIISVDVELDFGHRDVHWRVLLAIACVIPMEMQLGLSTHRRYCRRFDIVPP